MTLSGGRMLKSVEDWIQKSLHSDTLEDDTQDVITHMGSPSMGFIPHGPFVPRQPSFFGCAGPESLHTLKPDLGAMGAAPQISRSVQPVLTSDANYNV